MTAGRFTIEGIFSAQDRGFSSTLRKLESGLAKLNVGGKLTAGFTALGGAAQKATSAIASVGSAVVRGGATAGVAALGAGLYSTVRTGAEFEAAMSSVAAVSGATGAELAALTARAQELGSSTKFSATEVVGAMEAMTKSGFTVKETLTGVGGLLSAAAADGGDLAEISASIMASMKGLGLGPEKMQLFADQLAKAGDATAASIGTLTESMSKFGPVARQLGVPMESAIAQLALLQDAGIDASSAGTTLAAVYSKLAAPVGETKKALASLGIQVKDAFGNMRPPDQLMASIVKATDGIQGNVGKMSAITQLVGLESQKALLNIAAAAGAGKLDELTQSLKGAAGYADQIAKKRLGNLTGDFTMLKAAVDSMQISLFETQSGPLRGVVQGLTAWVNANKGVVQSGLTSFIEKATPVVQAFGEAFAQTWPAIKSVFSTLGQLAGGSGGWQAALIDGARALGKITAAALGAAGIFGGMLVGAFRLGTAAITTVVDAVEWIPVALGKVVFAVTDFVANVAAKWERMKADAGGASMGVMKELVLGITSGGPMVIFEMEKLGFSAMKAFLGAALKPLKLFDLPGLLGETVGKLAGNALEGGTPAPKAPVEDLSQNLEKRFALPTFTPAINSTSLGSDQSPANRVARVLSIGLPKEDERPEGERATAQGASAPTSMLVPPRRDEQLTEEVLTRAMKAALASTPERTEITIRDESGSAQVTRKAKSTRIKIEPTGGM